MLSVCGETGTVIKLVKQLCGDNYPANEVRYHLDKWLIVFAKAIEKQVSREYLGRVKIIKEIKEPGITSRYPSGYLTLFLQRDGDVPSRYEMGTGFYLVRSSKPFTCAEPIIRLKGTEYRQMIRDIVSWYETADWKSQVVRIEKILDDKQAHEKSSRLRGNDEKTQKEDKTKGMLS